MPENYNDMYDNEHETDNNDGIALINKRMLYFIGTMTLGALMVIGGFWQAELNMFISIGFAMICVSVVRLVQYEKLRQNPEQLKKYILQKCEERNVFIAHRCRSLMFLLSVYLEFAFVIVSVLLQQNFAAQMFSWLICAQVLIYCIVYYIYYKKY